MIIIANIYSAYCIVRLWNQTFVLKGIACIIIFFLIISGVIDFFVIKNDVLAKISDYRVDTFMSWIATNTKPDAVFITNGDIYDPVTISGRKTVTGREYFSYVYGIDSTKDFELRRKVLAGVEEVDNVYIAVYSDRNIPMSERLQRMYATVYADETVTVYHK